MASGKTLFKIEFIDGTVKEYEEIYYVTAISKAVSDKSDEKGQDLKFEDLMMESLLYLNGNHQWEYIIKKGRFTVGIE